MALCVETDRAGPPRDSGAVQGREERLRRLVITTYIDSNIIAQ